MADILQHGKTAFEFRIFDSAEVQIKNGKQSNSRHSIGVTNGLDKSAAMMRNHRKSDADFYDSFFIIAAFNAATKRLSAKRINCSIEAL